MKTLNPAVAQVFKRLHYPLDVILTCVRWYVAYPLSLRHLEDMLAERGVHRVCSLRVDRTIWNSSSEAQRGLTAASFRLVVEGSG